MIGFCISISGIYFMRIISNSAENLSLIFIFGNKNILFDKTQLVKNESKILKDLVLVREHFCEGRTKSQNLNW